MVYLLASLPDSYEILVAALEASENVPTMETFTAASCNACTDTTQYKSIPTSKEQLHAQSVNANFLNSSRSYSLSLIPMLTSPCPLYLLS